MNRVTYVQILEKHKHLWQNTFISDFSPHSSGCFSGALTNTRAAQTHHVRVGTQRGWFSAGTGYQHRLSHQTWDQCCGPIMKRDIGTYPSMLGQCEQSASQARSDPNGTEADDTRRFALLVQSGSKHQHQQMCPRQNRQESPEPSHHQMSCCKVLELPEHRYQTRFLFVCCCQTGCVPPPPLTCARGRGSIRIAVRNMLRMLLWSAAPRPEGDLVSVGSGTQLIHDAQKPHVCGRCVQNPQI